ncbi:MAG: cysteine desulfurase, partial [Erysipelotrichaceae bacterium]|nr:cysteine desulfurase [Erysipelotrichaceae bacterium]
MLDVLKIRKDFPMLDGKLMAHEPLVYLDNGATTFKPQCVIDAVTNYYTDMTSNYHRGDYELSYRVDVAFEAARRAAAGFINARPEEVVFTSGATASLNSVAYGYGLSALKEGDIILSTLSEHASNILPWFRVAEKTGARVEYIPFDDEGRVTVENFRKALKPEVKVVTLAAVSNVLGYEVPVKEICAIAHENGAIVVIDGAQSVPHMKTDVKDMDCDFLCFSSHKMCGPSGIGVMYGKYELLEKMDPLNLGGGSNARFNSSCNLILREVPYKFEAGTPAIEAVLGFHKAVEYLQGIGMDNVLEHEKALRAHFMERVKELDNVTVYNPNGDTGIITINVKGVFAQDAASYLSTKGIAVRSGNHCAKMLVEFLGTDATIRISPYVYNTTDD